MTNRTINKILVIEMFKSVKLTYNGCLLNGLILNHDIPEDYFFHFKEFKELFEKHSKYIYSIKLGTLSHLALRFNLFENFNHIYRISIEKSKLNEACVVKVLQNLDSLQILSIKNVIFVNFQQSCSDEEFKETSHKLDKVTFSQVSLKHSNSQLCNYFKGCKYIKRLYLSNLDSDKLLKPFIFDKSLLSLSFHFNHSFNPTKIYGEILSSNSSITKLSLESKTLNQSDINQIVDLLPHLKELNLNALSENRSYYDQVIPEIEIFLKRNMEINKLTLSHIQISLQCLYNILSSLPCLEELEITLGGKICRLAKVLSRSCPNLKYLAIKYIKSSTLQNTDMDPVRELFDYYYNRSPILCAKKLKSLTLINMDIVKFFMFYMDQYRNLDIFNFKQDFEEEMT
ncbi:hypothetical protein CONCODRAFT_6679, partial [Conidiobolus coronatus NRRL 28638]